jgi:BirA family transcriptional regulator, biotin operon repressor / biotin---[acetyl-CoA-carboxylase] ligase
MGESLARERVEPLLTGAFGRRYLYAAECESTQRLLDGDLPEGATAVCELQTAGRGRLGRSWNAPAGTAILCSVLLLPPSRSRLPELSLLGGIATAEVVEMTTGLAAQIKWPNDVMLNRRKVAGVLAEAVGGRVILGIGLNVNQRRDELPADAPSPASSLYATDSFRRDRAPILASLLARLEHLYGRWREGGFTAVFPELSSRDFLRGRRVTVNGETGVAAGIDREGRLELQIDGRRRAVESGEVIVG